MPVRRRPAVPRSGRRHAAALAVGWAAEARAGDDCIGCFLSGDLELRVGPEVRLRVDSDPALAYQYALLRWRDVMSLEQGFEIAVHPTWPSSGVSPIGLFTTVNLGPGTALFTGVPLISDLRMDLASQGPGFLSTDAFASAPAGPFGASFGPAFGGVLRLDGRATLHAMAGAVRVEIPLSAVGGPPGETRNVSLLGNDITVTHGPWITSTWRITGITTNVITIPARGGVQGVAFTLQPTPGETVMTPSTNGGFLSIAGGAPLQVDSVSVMGSKQLTAGRISGTWIRGIRFVAPLRIHTGAIAGRLPGVASMRMTFVVPEPGTAVVLLAGALLLAALGRRRGRPPRV